jgi:hypothetical protein
MFFMLFFTLYKKIFVPLVKTFVFFVSNYLSTKNISEST